MSSTTTAGGGGGGGVVRQGHLRKLKTMKKKFFVLRADSADNSARLEYYESEKKFKAGASPRRVLPLKSCYNIMRRLDLKQKHVIALFTREEQFCIVAENEQDLHAWLADILKQHCSDDASEELAHPIQHVWQVNVQKKGLGATKNIYGLYNLCLTDKTLTLVKIKSHNNVISEISIPERVEYSLKHIRRCGDSECFFYMEVGRQTTTGAGELWMHSDDSNIAQSMHSTIYHAMRNCAKESENERDHIVIPKNDGTLPARRQTYSDGRGRAGLMNEKGLCVGSCIRQCVCSTNTYSIDDSAAAVAPIALNAEYQHNTLTDSNKVETTRVVTHQRTVSLPTGCPLFQELKISHGRTHSAPLTGEELDRVVEKSVGKVNGTKSQARRASTGMRLSKLSPAHNKSTYGAGAGARNDVRTRCDSMPSRGSSSFEVERPPPRHNDIEGIEASRDEPDSVAEWHRTPRIPEEPDLCDMSKDLFNTSVRTGGSIQHSRTSSLGVEDTHGLDTSGYLTMEPVGNVSTPAGYLPMVPGHEPLGNIHSASSGSVCSGTPSTDPRFSEYQLEPATSHFGLERPPRAYSVGSRPTPSQRGEARHRAYSVGARARPVTQVTQHHPRASAEDLMMLDFSINTPPAVPITPAPASLPRDEYVDMSPRNAGYVEMRPGEPPPANVPVPPPVNIPIATPLPPPLPKPTTDGYVEMNYGRSATRPIAIGAVRKPPPAINSSPETRRTPLGSQTLFPFSLESPASPLNEPSPLSAPINEPITPVPLQTVAEEIARKSSGGISTSAVATSCSPQYVRLASAGPVVATEEVATATVIVAGAPAAAAKFAPSGAPINYATLDLEPRRNAPALTPRTYTQIDFIRSEKLHAADAT